MVSDIRNLFPIYVASKGRATTSKTIPQLPEGGEWCVVLEPQDVESYALPKKRVLVLPENDRGLAYVRQFILAHARSENLGWFWMLDDDISAFYRVVSGRNLRISLSEALSRAQDIFSKTEDVGQAGLEYQQFAWSAKKPFTLNSYCDVAVAIHTQRTLGVQFRQDLQLKVDRDFTLQVLASGYRTLRTCHIAFAAPENGSNTGGLSDTYAINGTEANESQAMVQLWGDTLCETHVKPSGRHDVKVNWKFFKNTLGG